jgi:hypothetical protein
MRHWRNSGSRRRVAVQLQLLQLGQLLRRLGTPRQQPSHQARSLLACRRSSGYAVPTVRL